MWLRYKDQPIHSHTLTVFYQTLTWPVLSLLNVPILPCPFLPMKTPVKAPGHAIPCPPCLLTNPGLSPDDLV